MIRSGLVSVTTFQLHYASREISNETIGTLFVIVERPTHLSADDLDAVGSGLLYRTNMRLGVGDLEIDLVKRIRIPLYRADCLLELHRDRTSSRLVHSEDPIIKLDESIVDS